MHLFFIGLLTASALFMHPSVPTWGTPIHLLRTPTLLEQINRHNPQLAEKLSPREMMFLEKPDSLKMVQAAFVARQLPCVGHDQERKTTYTGNVEKPDYVVVTLSGTTNLQTYVEQLSKNQLAHNFIIDRDGTIYPVTNKGESIVDALQHRLHSLGITRWIGSDGHEICDMNARSISIAMIGTNTLDPNNPHDQHTTQEQNAARAQLLAWLQTKYNIPVHHVIDYGWTAYPPGRRDCSSLPFPAWTKQNVFIRPDNQMMNTIDARKLSQLSSADRAFMLAATLRKLGYPCPLTSNEQNREFRQYITMFQQAYCLHDRLGYYNDTATLHTMLALAAEHEKHDPTLKDILPNVANFKRI